MRLKHNYIRFGFALLAMLWGGLAMATDHLAGSVVDRFAEVDPDAKVTVINPLKLEYMSATGRRHFIYLDNLDKRCDKAPDTCVVELDDFVQKMVKVFKEREPVPDKSKIYPVLRSHAYIEQAEKKIQQAKDGHKMREIIRRPFIAGTDIVYLYGDHDNMRFVNRGYLEQLGLTAEALDQAAETNSRTLPPLERQNVKGSRGLYFFAGEHGLGSSRIFDEALWQRLSKDIGPRIAAAVVTRDWVIFANADDNENVVKLRMLAARIVRKNAYPVSDKLMLWENGQWKPFEREEGAIVKQLPPL